VCEGLASLGSAKAEMRSGKIETEITSDVLSPIVEHMNKMLCG